MQIRRIAHVSVAVHSLDAVLPFYCEVLGLPLRERRTLPERGLHVAFVGVGESQIELLEPIDPEGTVARFLARRRRTAPPLLRGGRPRGRDRRAGRAGH
ncbi:MAG TPA: VOC family protein [Chloroflexota bacterium]|nr:VOC family protein [Chloroflexota bacterium]